MSNLFDALDGSAIVIDDTNIRVTVHSDNHGDGNSSAYHVSITSLQQPFTANETEITTVNFTVVGQWEMQSLLQKFAALYQLTQAKK